MYSIENHVGRLIEVRFWLPVGADEALGWRRDHEAMLQATLGNYVFFVDMMDATVFPPELVEAYVATMRSEPRLLRTVIVLGSSPTLSLQIQRMLRDAHHPQRRVYRDLKEAENWLTEIMTMPERTRLRELIERRSDVPGPSSQSPPSFATPPPSGGPPQSMRGPQSVRQPATMRLPVTPRSSSSGGQGNT
jgi:hypothetical protein